MATELRKKGFTLIELMVVLAIVGILMWIAIPSYQSFIQKENRQLAKQSLMACAANLSTEKIKHGHLENLLPKQGEAEINTICHSQIPESGTASYLIEIKIVNITGSYLLTAQPQSALAKSDGALTLTSEGQGCRITGHSMCIAW